MKLPIQLDRYTLVEAIGAGAFGRVYRAEVRGDMGFVSDFAVKVLDANVVQTNPNVAAQMADEARLLSQLGRSDWSAASGSYDERSRAASDA